MRELGRKLSSLRAYALYRVLLPRKSEKAARADFARLAGENDHEKKENHSPWRHAKDRKEVAMTGSNDLSLS
jgi:hypothetical protein